MPRLENRAEELYRTDQRLTARKVSTTNISTLQHVLVYEGKKVAELFGHINNCQYSFLALQQNKWVFQDLSLTLSKPPSTLRRDCLRILCGLGESFFSSYDLNEGSVSTFLPEPATQLHADTAEPPRVSPPQALVYLH
ncbi:MAG: hypothetical protein KZQ99_07035 [Candidatus Thiodiazotropha sp. (ex Dulcina madagascariensis)]|nr:hypothetical protein [Candidatus Thiodiazotropha sp. (ex Dulcina madagascariensis)]